MRRDSVPRPLTSLIGREADVAAARALLGDGIRLLTLTGPGGVGKTRLALRIAEEAGPAFPDGVVVVPLAAIADPALVLPAIVRAMGLREAGNPSFGELLAEYLRQRNILLVLDNFEQVRPAATRLTELIGVCPGLAFLVTSRALLRLGSEQTFPVTPLGLPVPSSSRATDIGDRELATVAASPAVQLFVARAQAVAPTFTLDDANASAVAAICHRLDGLPLAIELAAARIRLLSPGELLARLDPVLPLLSDGPEDVPDRLRTMRQAIAWSYELLSPQEQTLFHHLAIFVGGCTLEAVERVAAAPQGVTLDLLGSLIDMSLLRRVEESANARFGMLETIREFGLEQLAASGEHEAIAARHASWYLRFAE